MLPTDLFAGPVLCVNDSAPWKSSALRIYWGCATHCLSKSSIKLCFIYLFIYLCLLHITSEKPFHCEKYPWSSQFRLKICFRLGEELHLEKAHLICYFSIKNFLSKLAGLILPLRNPWAGSKADYYALAICKHRLWWCLSSSSLMVEFCVCEVFVLGCLNVGVKTVAAQCYEICVKTLCFSSRSGALLHAVSVFLPILPEYLIVLPVPLRGSIEQSVHQSCSEIGFLADNHRMGNFSSSSSCHCRQGLAEDLFFSPSQYSIKFNWIFIFSDESGICTCRRCWLLCQLYSSYLFFPLSLLTISYDLIINLISL